MIIEPKHYEYLSIQHGKVGDERGNSENWKRAYRASLDDVLNTIRPVLPTSCTHVLDIGSGLGGIDVLVAHHYDPQPRVCLVDGVDDPPVVKNSYTTFNNAEVAVDFQKKNGVKQAICVRHIPHDQKFDLIHSYYAYGFHVHPGNYLDDVKKAMHEKTVCIFDVRRTKREWLRAFVEALGVPKTLAQTEKHVRLAFNA